jgi:membrane-associated phospholipid phosphatase
LNRWLLATGLVLLSLAALLSVAAARQGRFAGDLWLTREVEELGFPGVRAARALRFAGGTEATLAVGGAGAGLLLWRGRRREAAWLAVGLVVLPLAQAGLKEAVDRPRPSPLLVERHGDFDGKSFPAGHAMSPAVVYGYLGLVLGRARVGAGWKGAAAATGLGFLTVQVFANLFLGAHWPSDLVGGVLWGGAMAALLAGAARWPMTGDSRGRAE